MSPNDICRYFMHVTRFDPASLSTRSGKIRTPNRWLNIENLTCPSNNDIIHNTTFYYRSGCAKALDSCDKANKTHFKFTISSSMLQVLSQFRYFIMRYHRL